MMEPLEEKTLEELAELEFQLRFSAPDRVPKEAMIQLVERTGSMAARVMVLQKVIKAHGISDEELEQTRQGFIKDTEDQLKQALND